MPGGVHQVIARTAGLDAVAPVGAAAVQPGGQPALPAVADAQGAVDEAFHFAGNRRTDGADGLQGQFPLQDDAGAARRLEAPGVFHAVDGALGGGVQRNGDVRPAEAAQVADDKGIGAGLLRGKHLRVHLFFLPLAQADIKRHEHPRAIAVGVRAEPRNVPDGIACGLAGPEIRTGDIDGIGTAVDGRDADVSVPCRSEEFEFPHYFSAARAFCASAPSLGSFTAFW